MEFQTTPPGTVFRQTTNFGSNIDRPSIPPEGRTLDQTQEFGGQNESQYSVSNAPDPARSNRSLASGSVTSQSESGSAGNSTINDDGDRTIHTSQHALGPPQGLGSSPAQPPNPGHASTSIQLQSRTPGSDRSTSSSPICHSLFKDEFWAGPDLSRSHTSQLGHFSNKEMNFNYL